MGGIDDDDELTPVHFPSTAGLNKALTDGDTLVLPQDPSGTGSADSNFDYAAFEASLDAIHSAEEERIASVASEHEPSGPVVRKTLLRRPRTEDATYAVRPLGRFMLVSVQGRINEAFDGESLGAQIAGSSVVFDLGDVDRITSFGVRGWLRLMQRAALTEAYFVRCSESVVNQITMIHNFCGPARVHSLIAPYQCDACGAEFGVPLYAVQDADLLRGRRPPTVSCPECRTGTEMDEDPWVFLDLDQQLLEEVPADLAQALELLSSEPRHSPIEKSISSGSGTTRITFNGVLDGKTRFRRALSGIEGRVVVDLSHTEEEDEEGLRALLDGLRGAAADVELFRIEGVGPELARALLSEVVPKLSVGSIRFQATNGAGIGRRVVIDVPENREALLTGRSPRVDAAWASGGVQLEHTELVASLVEALGAEVSLAATPAPAQRAGPPSGHNAMPMYGMTPVPAQYATGYDSSAPTTTFMHPYASQPGMTPAPMAYMQAPMQAPASSSASRYILAATVVLALLSVVVVLGAVAVVVFSRPGPIAEAPVAAPAVANTDEPSRADGEWSSGGVAPPAWAGSPVMQTDSQLFLVGTGSGVDASMAQLQARQAAEVQLARYALLQIQNSPMAAGINNFPIPQDVVELSAALKSGQPLPMMTEAQSAHREIRGQHETAVQFAVDKANLNSYLASYLSSTEYRGLVLAPTPPWSKPGMRLVSVPTWYKASVGAVVDTVGDLPVTSATDFVRVADETFERLAEGDGFDIHFRGRQGDESVRISKKAAQSKPKPVLMRQVGR